MVQIVRQFFPSLLLWQLLGGPVLGKELIALLWFALATRLLIFPRFLAETKSYPHFVWLMFHWHLSNFLFLSPSEVSLLIFCGHLVTLVHKTFLIKKVLLLHHCCFKWFRYFRVSHNFYPVLRQIHSHCFLSFYDLGKISIVFSVWPPRYLWSILSYTLFRCISL